jgi:hypothetical protein
VDVQSTEFDGFGSLKDDFGIALELESREEEAEEFGVVLTVRVHAHELHPSLRHWGHPVHNQKCLRLFLKVLLQCLLFQTRNDSLFLTKGCTPPRLW